MKLAILLATAALLAGCEGSPCGVPDNTLAGSISELYDIASDSVRIRRVDANTLTIEYMNALEDTVANVVVDLRGFEEGARIPLNDGDVYRITAELDDFPSDLSNGSVTILSGLEEGQEVNGCFRCVFNMSDGGQRTLRGAFRGILETIEVVP